ncbi:MAG: SCO family protein [Rhodomicrobium sp.]|nr:SCO family protein [Rhodomicrobium sp.]
MRLASLALTALIAIAAAGVAFAHDGVEHATKEEAAGHAAEMAAAALDTPGFPNVAGGDFRLTDQFGRERSSRDPAGRYQLIFFGYASCKAICSVALPRMAEAVDLLAAKGVSVTPLLITVDPERDTVETMREAAPAIHPRLIGLTGSQDDLAAAYKAFSVEKKLVYVHPEEGPVYAHGTFIYLTGPDGAFKTLMPPVLGAERIADIVQKYAGNPVAAR